jgi:phospholipase C
MNRPRENRRLIVAAAVAGLAFLQPVAHRGGAAWADALRSDEKNFQHVFFIIMENTGYDHLIGNANAPWINEAAQTYGLATNYHGVSHPSQPNYVAAIAGSNYEVVNDNDITIDHPNLVDQLEPAGKSWKGYMQAYALCDADGDGDLSQGEKLAHACGNQLYERKHNPFVSFADIQSSAARMANLVDLTQLDADLASGDVPDYVWISPDQCHDMHGRGAPASDPCSFSNEDLLIQAGDEFLADTVGKITASSAWTGNSLIVIVWDESDFPFNDTSSCAEESSGGGHVVALTISHSDHSARSSDQCYDHYSVLSTIEDGWDLGCLANTCSSLVSPMSDLVGPQQ